MGSRALFFFFSHSHRQTRECHWVVVVVVYVTCVRRYWLIMLQLLSIRLAVPVATRIWCVTSDIRFISSLRFSRHFGFSTFVFIHTPNLKRNVQLTLFLSIHQLFILSSIEFDGMNETVIEVYDRRQCERKSLTADIYNHNRISLPPQKHWPIVFIFFRSLLLNMERRGHAKFYDYHKKKINAKR